MHARISFSPTHTCAACKQTYPNNHALEKHAANERRQAPRKPHQAFLCTCGADFGRLGSLDRHITAQDGPKYYCDYCDDSKGFARLDKLVDHLRDTHKFGDKAIALARNQARVQSDGSGHPPFRDAATGTALPVSTSVAHDAAMEGISQTGYSAGPPAGPTGSLDGGLAEFNMSSAAEFQGFGAVDDYSRIAATEDFVGFDVSGLDLSGVDLADFDMDMDISGMGDPF